MDELTVAFNTTVRGLMKKLYRKNKSAEVDRLKKRIGAVINATPMLLLTQGSSYIWDYRKDIKAVYDDTDDSYRWELFTERDYSEHYSNEEGAVEIAKLIDIIKDVFNNADEYERIECYHDVCDLVGVISKYRKLLKSQAK